MSTEPSIAELATAYGRIGAHLKWAKTTDRTAATAPARAALEQKWLDQADGDPVRAAHLRTAHYQRMALRSVQARRAKKLDTPPRGPGPGASAGTARKTTAGGQA